LPEDREDICLKCGRCCVEKFVLEGTVYYTHTRCKFQDPATGLCTVYENRHDMHPDCLRLDEGIKLGVFPADCPYVRDLPDYNPPVTDLSKEMLEAMMDVIEDDDE